MARIIILIVLIVLLVIGIYLLARGSKKRSNVLVAVPEKEAVETRCSASLAAVVLFTVAIFLLSLIFFNNPAWLQRFRDWTNALGR